MVDIDPSILNPLVADVWFQPPEVYGGDVQWSVSRSMAAVLHNSLRVVAICSKNRSREDHQTQCLAQNFDFYRGQDVCILMILEPSQIPKYRRMFEEQQFSGVCIYFVQLPADDLGISCSREFAKTILCGLLANDGLHGGRAFFCDDDMASAVLYASGFEEESLLKKADPQKLLQQPVENLFQVPVRSGRQTHVLSLADLMVQTMKVLRNGSREMLDVVTICPARNAQYGPSYPGVAHHNYHIKPQFSKAEKVFHYFNAVHIPK